MEQTNSELIEWRPLDELATETNLLNLNPNLSDFFPFHFMENAFRLIITI